MFATRQGTVKKTEFQAYNTPIKADGIIAIKIRDDDELVAVRRVDPGDEILIVSHEGLTVRFKEEDARAMGRDTSGVRGMNVSGKDNYVLAMDVARPGQDLLVVTEAGYGKRTDVDEYRLTSRGAKGVKTISFTEAKGLLAAALVVREHEDLVFISQNGMVQRTGVRGINRYGRAVPGRAGDEPARGRRGVGGRAGGRDRGRRERRRRGSPRRVDADGADGVSRSTPSRRRRRRGRRRGRRGLQARLGQSSSAAEFATLRLPEKGGGPKLSDSYCGTLEVSGR